MSVPFQRAQPPLRFIAPDLNLPVLAVSRFLLSFWLSWRERIVEVQAEGVEQLVALYDQFQQQQVRFLLAFRHPSPEDPFCLAQLLWRQVPETAQQLKINLRGPVHAHFIYDRGIPLWAGRWVGWLYSKLGATPIQRGSVDLQGLRSARTLFAQGTLPMAAAPEGGNNGHTEIVSPLEPGLAQLGFWCVEDLAKAKRSETVVIVPLGISYDYIHPPWKTLEKRLNSLEAACGLTAFKGNRSIVLPSDPGPFETLYPRLLRLGEHLLGLMETFYKDYYGWANADPEQPLSQRLDSLLDAALGVAESYFQLSAKGGVIDRCRRIEQAGWDWIFRDELQDRKTLAPVERGLADRIAEEASLRMWHMRLVENFVAVTGEYVRSDPSPKRFAETLFLLRDTVMLLEGKPSFPRPKLGPQRAYLKVGTPISVSDRWANYKTGRRAAVAALTQDLQTALEALI